MSAYESRSVVTPRMETRQIAVGVRTGIVGDLLAEVRTTHLVEIIHVYSLEYRHHARCAAGTRTTWWINDEVPRTLRVKDALITRDLLTLSRPLRAIRLSDATRAFGVLY